MARHVPGCFDVIVREHLQHSVSADVGAENTPRNIAGAGRRAVSGVEPETNVNKDPDKYVSIPGLPSSTSVDVDGVGDKGSLGRHDDGPSGLEGVSNGVRSRRCKVGTATVMDI